MAVGQPDDVPRPLRHLLLGEQRDGLVLLADHVGAGDLPPRGPGERLLERRPGLQAQPVHRRRRQVLGAPVVGDLLRGGADDVPVVHLHHGGACPPTAASRDSPASSWKAHR